MVRKALLSGTLQISMVGVAAAQPQYFSGTGSYYELVYEYVPWQEASTAAASRTFNGLSGHLASVTSPGENDFLTGMIASAPDENFFDFGAAWLGGYRNANQSPWQWSTGEPWTYSNWHSVAPDGKSYADAHVHLLRHRPTDPGREGHWNDYDTDLGPQPVEAYFVEYEPTAAPQNKTHVLSIGMNYGSDGLRGDIAAERVKNAFSQYGNVDTNWLLPLDYDEPVFTQNNTEIKAMVNAMKANVAPGATFVMYLGGHGLYEDSGDELQVNAQNDPSDLTSREPTTGDELFCTTWEWNNRLSDDELSAAFGDDSSGAWEEDELWKQVNKIFIVDSCFSGGFVGTDINGDTGDLSRLSKVAVLSSAGEANFGFTRPDPETGDVVSDFSQSLVAALQNLSNQDRVTVGRLFSETDLLGSTLFEDGSLAYITGLEDYWDVQAESSFALSLDASDDFEFAIGVPEPASLALLGIGGLAILRRRRGAGAWPH